MSEHGGCREGAGRPPGSRNPNTKAKREAIKAVVAQFEATTPNVFEGDAVALMQLIYRDPSQDMGLRLDAAKSAAKFERPTLAAIAMQQPPRTRLDVSVLNAFEQGQGMRTVLSEQRKGIQLELTPAPLGPTCRWRMTAHPIEPAAPLLRALSKIGKRSAVGFLPTNDEQNEANELMPTDGWSLQPPVGVCSFPSFCS